MAEPTNPMGALYGGALNSCGVSGGALYDGGAEALAAYEGSAAHQAKKKLVSGLIAAYKSLNPPGASELDGLMDMAKAGDLAGASRGLLAFLPGPNENVQGTDSQQAKFCRQLASTLNSEFTAGGARPIFNLDLSPSELCVQVREVIGAVAAGLQTELVGIRRSAETAIGNLDYIGDSITEYRKEAEAALNAALSSGASDSDPTEELEMMKRRIAMAEALESERSRQLLILRGLVTATLDPEDELKTALSMSDEKKRKVALTDLSLGSSSFASVLTDAMRGIGDSAALTAKVNAALKDVGISMKTYKEMTEGALKEMVELKSLLAAEKDPKKDPYKIAEAFAVLKNAFGQRKMLGGYEGGASGGASSSALDKRIAAKKKNRAVILTSFVRSYHKLIRSLANTINSVGQKMGKQGFPVTRELKELLDAMMAFGTVAEASVSGPADNLRFERQLMGLVTEAEKAQARSVRESFLSAVSRVTSAVSVLKSMPEYSRAASDLDALGRAVGSFRQLIDSVVGGDEAVEGGDIDIDLSDLPAMDVSIRSAIRSFRYFFFAAEIRENIRNAAKEIGHYGDGYEEMLDKAVRSRVLNLKQAYKAFLESDRPNGMGGAMMSDAARKMISNEFKCKKKFYEALLTVDKYLKEFTAAVTNDPEAVADIVRTMSGLPMNDRWFSEATGDKLADAFEAHNANPLPRNGAYLQDLAAANNAAVAAGNPGFAPASVEAGVPIESAQAESVVDNVKDAINNFTAMKNIINVFFRVGDKFGSKRLYKSASMTPEQVSNAFRNYLRCSAFTNLEAPNAAAGRVAAAPAPVAPQAPQGTQLADVQADVMASFQQLIDRAIQLGQDQNVNAQAWDDIDDLVMIASQSAAIAMNNNAQVDAAINALMAAVPGRNHSGPLGAVPFNPFPFNVGVAYRQGNLVRQFLGMIRNNPPTPLPPGMAAIAAAPPALPSAPPVRREEILRLSSVNDFGPLFAEDDLFVYALQAMCGKVFTTLGISNLLETPSPLYTSMPTRAIIGGGVEGGAIAEVDPRAVPLYYKVLRLAEFYRQLLEFDDGDATQSQIALLPDADGTFGGLIQALFLQIDIASSQNGTYSDREVTDILAELNSIYKKFSGESDPAEAACREFIAEVNRRIGVVSRAQYEKTRDLYYESMDTNANTFGRITARSNTNYAILPDEGELDFGGRPSPLDTIGDLDTGAASSGTGTGAAGNVRIDRWPIVKRFREKLDGLFSAVPAGSLGQFDISTKLEDAQRAIQLASPGTGRFNAAADLIRSGRAGPAAIIAGQDSSISVMFHETVVTGLVVLEGVYQTLDGFRNLATALPGLANAPRAATFEISRLHRAFPGMVGFSASSGGVRVDFTKVRSLAEGLVADVRKFLGAFRSVLPDAVITQYMGGAAPVAGTLLYYEENMIQGMFTAPRRTSRDPAARVADNSLDSAVELFTRGTSSTGPAQITVAEVERLVARVSGLAAANPFAVAPLDSIFPPAPGAAGAAGPVGTVGYIPRNVPGGIPVPGFNLPTYAQTAPNNATPVDAGIVETFNDLIGKFIAAFFDNGSGKIYRDLIENFAGGVFGAYVMDNASGVGLDAAGASFALSPAALALGTNAAKENPLSAGLCEILRRILTEKDQRTQLPTKSVSTLSEVPIYTQQKMTSLLPVFIEQFQELIEYGRWIKNLCSELSLQGGQLPDIYATIDRVSDGCYALIDSAQMVLAQVGGDINYLEFAKDGIQTYRSRNGTDPLTPLSTLTTLLGANSATIGQLLTPMATGPNAKFLHGVRGVFTGGVGSGIGAAPALGSVVEKFNKFTGGRASIDKGEFGAFANRVGDAVRFLANAHAKSRAANGVVGVLLAAGPRPNVTYQITPPAPTLTSIVQLTERTDQDVVMRMIAGAVQQAAGAAVLDPADIGGPAPAPFNANPLLARAILPPGGAPGGLYVDRDIERIGVLVDLNMMPINVHALMRGIPFANLYNYAYTFRQFTGMFFGVFASDVSAGYGRAIAGGPRSSADMRSSFLQLIFEPYTSGAWGPGGGMIDAAPEVQFNNGRATNLEIRKFNAMRAALGDRNAEVGGNQRFSKDQLFGKALLGSVVGSAIGVGQQNPLGARASRIDVVQFQGRDPSVGPPTRDEPARGRARFNLDQAAAAAFSQALVSRWNTRLVRNMAFITNLQQLLVSRLSEELMRSHSVIPKGLQILNPSFTQYGHTGAIAHENNRGYYYADANEVAGDRTYPLTD